MKKGITGLIPIGTLILMLGLTTGEIGADWRIGGFGGYYAPQVRRSE